MITPGTRVRNDAAARCSSTFDCLPPEASPRLARLPVSSAAVPAPARVPSALCMRMFPNPFITGRARGYHQLDYSRLCAGRYA